MTAAQQASAPAVHLDIARAHRDASLKIGYSAPAAARTCRRLMREHALKARGYTTEKPTKVATRHE